MYGLEDPLDSPDFDPIAFINQNFPTESSLDGLDTFVVGISSQISTLDEEISKAVQAQSVAGKQASKDIVFAQESILDLFEKIADIKAKSSQSERMVNEICHDIKKLDCAKTHLQSSITSLKRLQMLITAVGQLEMLAKQYHYKEAANLLDAVKQLMTHFNKYTNIPIIKEIQERVEKIQNDLKTHVHKSFKDIGQLLDTVADVSTLVSDMPGGMKHLFDSCLVVDSLGAAVRRELLEEFVRVQLQPYDALFGPDKAHSNLDQVDRRWAWFKRLLKTVDLKFASVCPPHWRLPLRLCLEFTDRTKNHIVEILTALESKDQMDVNLLLKALQTTLRFEQEMASRFGAPTSAIPTSTPIATVRDSGKENNHSFPYSTAVPRAPETQMETEQRLKNQDKLLYVPTDHGRELGEDEMETAFLRNAQLSISAGMSGVFDKFMGSYVLLERQNLEEMLAKLNNEEDTASRSDVEAYGNLYSSASSMFVFIKNSMKRCTALSNGQTFLSLCKEFKTCLQKYSEMLKSRCPPPVTIQSSSPFFPSGNNSYSNLMGVVGSSSSSSTSSVQPQGSTVAAEMFRIPLGGETSICFLMNTAEYCAEVVPQLEGMLKSKMSPSLVDRVDLSSEVEVFVDLVAYALKVLVSGILDRLEVAFRLMSSTNWTINNQVGEESPYVHQMSAVLVDALPKVRDAINSSYLNNFCSKLAAEILQRFLDIILRQKRISESSSQQLLLDTYNIKTVLMHLHAIDAPAAGSSSAVTPSASSSSSVNASAAKAAPAMYVRLVTAKVSHIETILKLIGTPEPMLVERFRIMWLDGQPSDLQPLMALKGMRKADQQVLLDQLGTSVPKGSGPHTGTPPMKHSQSSAYSAESPFASDPRAQFSSSSSTSFPSSSSEKYAASMGAYTGAAASQFKNFGDLSTTAVGNIKSFAGNLVSRRTNSQN